MSGRPSARAPRGLLCLAALLAGACSSWAPATGPTPPSADAPWLPPAEAIEPPPPPPSPTLEIPPELLAAGATVSLAQVVDVALANSPTTRETWMAARSAAAEVGSKRAAYYPQVDLQAEIQRQKLSAVGGLFNFQQTVYGPSLDLSMLLFDFGDRKAEVEEARQRLLAADWLHNAAVQTVVLTVEQAYYGYLTARSLSDSLESDLERARTSLEAAQERHEAGVATVAEVLQARTALSQVQLALTRVNGQIQATRGALATAMGLSPDVPVEVGLLPESIPVRETADAVGEALEEALANRPDLAAARARAAAAESHVDKVRAEARPQISLRTGYDRVYYGTTPGTPSADNYSASLVLSLPLFTGFENHFDVEQAKADAEAARARLEELRQQVQLDVWTSYYDLQTAGQQVETSRDLVASAQETVDVTDERYKAGVGSILDLLTAQAALATARAQAIEARARWFLAVSRLAYDTGILGLSGPGAPGEGTAPQEGTP